MPPSRTDIKSNDKACPYIKEIDKMKKSKVQALMETMQHHLAVTLPESQRRAYQTAAEIVPELVQQETPLVAFLRTDGHDPAAAASRLANYWDYRQDLFGTDRWLLPLTQTGVGALQEPEIAFLRTGCFFNMPCGESGHRIMIVDHSKANHVFARAAKEQWDVSRIFERICMYLTTVCTTPIVQTTGATLLYPITTDRRPVLELRFDLWQRLRTALPFKFDKVVVAQAYAPHHATLLDFCTTATATVVQYNSQLQPVQVRAPSWAQTLLQLEQLGLDRSRVPVVLGGTMDHERKVAEWTRAQLSVEQVASAAPLLFGLDLASSTRTTAAAAAQSTAIIPRRPKRKRHTPYSITRDTNTTATTIAAVASSSTTSTTVAAETTKTTKTTTSTIDETSFVRQRNALYSRRLYHKRKLQTTALKQQVQVLQRQQSTLRAQHDRLQQLWQQAQTIVANGGGTSNNATQNDHGLANTLSS